MLLDQDGEKEVKAYYVLTKVRQVLGNLGYNRAKVLAEIEARAISNCK